MVGSRRTRPRVGFLIDRWDPNRGGAERALARLADRLDERGWEVHVFASSSRGTLPGDFHRIEGRGWTRARRERSLANRLVGAAEELGCVTVGIRHLSRVDLYWPHDGSPWESLLARRRATGRSEPEAPYGRHRLFVELERDLLERGGARRVACVSTLVRDELARLYPACADRLVLAPNGVDRARFHPRLRQRAEELRRAWGLGADPVLLFAGADGERKGLGPLLTALAACREEPWRLVVAGVRHPKRWEKAAWRAGLGPGRVHFVAHTDPTELFSVADLTLLPTWRDTCGLVLLESLSTGVPVITTRHAGASELLADDRAGEVLPSPDPEAWAEAVRRWLSRLRAGGVDHDAVRASTTERDEVEWLRGMEGLVSSLAVD